MSDKFRTTQPIKVTIADGEQPSRGKLTVMAEQPRLGASLLEKAMGDIWNQSGDSVLSFSPLQITNLARTLGGAKYLNPALYPVNNDFEFTEELGFNNQGMTTGYLKFPPKTSGTISVQPITPAFTVVQEASVASTGNSDTLISAIFPNPVSDENTIVAIMVAQNNDIAALDIDALGVSFDITPIYGGPFTEGHRHQARMAFSTSINADIFNNQVAFAITGSSDSGSTGRAMNLYILEVQGLWTLLDPIQSTTGDTDENVSTFGPGVTPASVQENSATIGFVTITPVSSGDDVFDTFVGATEEGQVHSTGSTVNLHTAVTSDTVTGLGTTHNFTADWGGVTGFFDSFVAMDIMLRLVEDRHDNQVDDEDDVDAVGDWWVDLDTGRFRFYLPLFREDRLTYDVALTEDSMQGQELLPSVIPDPDQDTFTSCRISTNGGKYYIHLPPRRPVRDGTNTIHETLPRNYPSSDEESLNEQGTVGQGAPFKLWSSSTAALNGAGDEHYRYFLPKEIQDRFSNIADGEELPSGFLYLWDINLGTVIEDVVFKKTTVSANQLNTIFEVTSNTYDFSLVATGDTLVGSEVEANYNSTNLILITTGSSLSRSILRLTQAIYSHEHNSLWSLDTPIKHSSLVESDILPTASPLQSVFYRSYLPEWGSSQWVGDPHLSLLSRGGSQGNAYKRDEYDNAMLGPLILANADQSGANNFLDDTVPDDTFKIYFGGFEGGAGYIYRTSAGISAYGGDGSTIGFRAIGDATTDGIGVYGEGTGTDGVGVKGEGINGTGVVGLSAGDDSRGGHFSTIGSNSIGVNVSVQGIGSKAISARSDWGYAGYFWAENTWNAAIHVVPQTDDPYISAHGDIYISDDPVLCTPRFYDGNKWRPISGVIHTITSSIVINPSDTPTNLSVITLPKNIINAGNVLRITAAGLCSPDTSSESLKIRNTIDTAILDTTSASSIPATGGHTWRHVSEVTFRTAPPNISLMITTELTTYNGTIVEASQGWSTTSAYVSGDTFNVGLEACFGTTNVGAITLDNIIIELL